MQQVNHRREHNVEMIPRHFAPVRRAAVATACLIMLAGCHGENSPGDAKENEEEHAGHVIPAHKPKTFPDAVRRLRELNDHFLRDGTGKVSGSPTGPTNLQIALDIANWLPEIAADSDMPETPWNEVNARSARLTADYQALMANTANARTEVEQANAEIGQLEKLLLACDTRWFQGTGNVVAAP
jgi:hypothetical protein